MAVKFGYWDIRGLGQPIRLLLEYVGVKYEETRYNVGDAPAFDGKEWFDKKFTLGLAFPNLPYYMDDEIKLTQTHAILRHLARKHKLYGSSLAEEAQVDLLLTQTMDLRNNFIEICYGPGYNDEKCAKYVKDAQTQLAAYEKYLGSKKFFLGDKVTVCDFHIYEILEQHRLFNESIFANTPKLKAYLKRFEELPAIKKYLGSSKFKARPINSPGANFF